MNCRLNVFFQKWCPWANSLATEAIINGDQVLYVNFFKEDVKAWLKVKILKQWRNYSNLAAEYNQIRPRRDFKKNNGPNMKEKLGEMT